MAVGFLVDCFFYEVGRGDFLHSFFSTISYHLETEGWGTKYPYLLKRLYRDKLSWLDVGKAREELRDIERQLQVMSPDKVIWDIDDLSQKPPWGENISPKVTNLANYFASSDGRTFFELLYAAFQVAEEDRCDIIIHQV
ncbi:immunity 70 family protein [Rubeoparvulum massiliense]|uniref:immunity 70 family protein n=1 Tax=Rubeoparvulum massiliense TaxID=1631346 RepID=UPI00065E0B15|nr:immunity 70 family protein [Rubeoparvulum massiliense]